jgi:hypothetical protein
VRDICFDAVRNFINECISFIILYVSLNATNHYKKCELSNPTDLNSTLHYECPKSACEGVTNADLELGQQNSISAHKVFFNLSSTVLVRNWIIDTYINVLYHPVPNDAGVSTITSDGNIEDAEEDSDKEDEYNEHSEMEEDVEKSDCDVEYCPENEFNEAETDFGYVIFSLHQY